MSSTTNIVATLGLITDDFTISTSLFVFIFGIIGNILNIIVFGSLKTFRKNPCAFCLLILSISDSGMLLFNTVPNILTYIFNNHGGINAIFACKISIDFGQIFALISHSIICLAAIDQYLSTSINKHYKGMSFTLTRHLIVIIIFVWILHGIPFLIYYDAQILPGTNVTSCRVNDNNGSFSKYLIYVCFPIVGGFLPISIMSVFALAALRNVRIMTKRKVNIIRLRLEQQLTAMVLMKILTICITIVPFLISYIIGYTIAYHNSDPIVQEKFLLVNRIFTFLLFVNYAVSIIFSRFI